MSTRGPKRWCPKCHGQVYFHHVDTSEPGDEDVYYCQGCGIEVLDSATVMQLEGDLAHGGIAAIPEKKPESKPAKK